MTLAGLDQVGGRNPAGVVGRTREGIGSGAIGKVVESSAADIRDVDAEAELMFAIGVSGEVGAVEVVFGSPRIGLRAARGKQPRDRDLRLRIEYSTTCDIEVSNEKSQLVHPVWRELVKMADVDLVFQKAAYR